MCRFETPLQCSDFTDMLRRLINCRIIIIIIIIIIINAEQCLLRA